MFEIGNSTYRTSRLYELQQSRQNDETDLNAMRFHWRRDEHSPLTTLRFTRALIGLTSSPFLLGGVINAHPRNLEEK